MGRMIPWLACFLVLVFAEPAMADERYAPYGSLEYIVASFSDKLVVFVYVFVFIFFTGLTYAILTEKSSKSVRWELLAKNIGFSFGMLKCAINQERNLLKIIAYLFLLALIATAIGGAMPDIAIMGKIADFCIEILGPIIPLIGFLVILTWFKNIKKQPYKPMLTSEHIELLQQLETINIFPTHSNGTLNYDWDDVLDRLYNDQEHHEIYRKIVKHYWYLKWHHLVLKDLTHLPNVENCGKIKEGILD